MHYFANLVEINLLQNTAINVWVFTQENLFIQQHIKRCYFASKKIFLLRGNISCQGLTLLADTFSVSYQKNLRSSMVDTGADQSQMENFNVHHPP